MSLQQNLGKPLLLEPLKGHTHTVVFLHKFAPETTEKEVSNKVLSNKLTKDHTTLRLDFPTVRWVFPYPKLHPNGRHWTGLSPQDIAGVGLDDSGLPYITQIILQEAKHAGGLDKIILGGQGETAIAAHDAMTKFPEMAANQSENMAAFIQQHFHPSWTNIEQLRLGGFIGMHPQSDKTTRDERDFWLMSKFAGKEKVSSTIMRNTPHKFIQGGYKVQTVTWDGRRIDEFAESLAENGVTRVTDGSQASTEKETETLTPKDRTVPAREGLKEDNSNKRELTEEQKHAEDIKRQKKADKDAKERVLKRIDYDKLERKRRIEREKASRMQAATAAAQLTDGKAPKDIPSKLTQPVTSNAFPNGRDGGNDDNADDDYEDDAFNEPSYQNHLRKRKSIRERKQKPWLGWDSIKAGGDLEWKPRAQGQMSESQMKALGLQRDENVKEEKDNGKTGL
ncbi:hypothetical protein BJ170DRAFT_624469 [Xylariales sp. AK1849]|nr:hypothetical protein BJ170DRAFT_624469 [Xylariales sp. AK1849]